MPRRLRLRALTRREHRFGNWSRWPSPAAERGLAFSNWSVPKLADYCRGRRLLPPVSDEWVRRLLRREGLTAQRIRTWKVSQTDDLEHIARRRRI